MQVLVVQPPNPPPVLALQPKRPELVPHFALLNLCCYLQNRSRHLCRVIDANLLDRPLTDAVEAVVTSPNPRVLLVHAPIDRVVETRRFLDACGGPQAAVKIALFGALPTLFPTLARSLAPHAYLVRGDPETPLKSMIDFVDLPQRLEKIPGLISPESDHFTDPTWLPSLSGIGLDSWQSMSWLAVPRGRDEIPHEAVLRITRGNSGLPPDRDFPGQAQPLRIMNPKELVSIFEKLSSWGVSCAHLDDPPGAWTPELLEDWLQTIESSNNGMAWSIRMLPTMLNAATIRRLSYTGCREIRFLIPSTRPEIMASYGIVLGIKPFAHTVRQLRAARVDTRFDFWIGGPGEPQTEEERIFQYLRKLGYPDHEISPFPRHLDSPRTWEENPDLVFQELEAEAARALRPETQTSQPHIHGGAAAVPRLASTVAALEQRLRRSLIWTVKNNWQNWNPLVWINRLEAFTMKSK